MSELTLNTDAYSRLKVPGAIAARLVDDWIDSCKDNQHQSECNALLVELEKVRRYLQLADKDVRQRGARSKRNADNRPSSAERDYRDFLMMAIGTVDAIESISIRRSEGQGLTSNSKTFHRPEKLRKAIFAIIDVVDGFEGPTLTDNERGWLEEYVRQLRERFPEQIEDVIVCSPDHDPELRTMVLVRDEERTTEKEVSTLGYMIDMSGFFVAPLIHVISTKEWAYRKRIGDPTYKMVQSEGVSVV